MSKRGHDAQTVLNGVGATLNTTISSANEESIVKLHNRIVRDVALE